MKSGALLCSGAALGGAGGYAASASGASAAPPAQHARAHKSGHAGKQAGARSLQARLRRAVSLTAVVPDGKGSFATVSLERGTLVSLSGEQLTLSEGTRRATYKTVTVSLPANAVVRLSRQPSSVSALTPGDLVEIVQGPRQTTVLARPASATSTTTQG